MEPRRDDGDDFEGQQKVNRDLETPQWSPVVTTGTTGLSAADRRRQL